TNGWPCWMRCEPGARANENLHASCFRSACGTMAMRRHDPNRHQLTAVASALGDALREQLVFVGGSIAGLLLDDPAAGEIRATTDVDAIVEARLGQFHAIEEQVAQRGFSRD